MPLSLVLLLLVQAASSRPATGPSVPTPAQAASTLPADIADSIKQVVTKVTALGERARVCEARLNDDMTSLRDIQSREADTKNKIVEFQKNQADANAHAVAARGQNPALGDAQRAALLAKTEITTMDARLTQLNSDEQRYRDDAGKQQVCIDQAHAALLALINPPKSSTK